MLRRTRSVVVRKNRGRDSGRSIGIRFETFTTFQDGRSGTLRRNERALSSLYARRGGTRGAAYQAFTVTSVTLRPPRPTQHTCPRSLQIHLASLFVATLKHRIARRKIQSFLSSTKNRHTLFLLSGNHLPFVFSKFTNPSVVSCFAKRLRKECYFSSILMWPRIFGKRSPRSTQKLRKP